MWNVQPDLLKRMSDLHRAETMRSAEQWRLLRQAGLARSRLLPRAGCWLLCRVGRLLVALGQQLEQYGAPRPVPLEG